MPFRSLRQVALVLVVVSLVWARPAPGQDAGVPSTTGLVVSTSAPASDVGAAVLRRGGNAVDAAVATAFALAVTHPSAGNLGGGGFMVVRTPSGEATTFDYRERAPLGATRTMYLDAKGAIDRGLTAAGYLAPGVPGTVRGLALAHARFGRLPWADVVTPAAELAARGVRVSASLARGLNYLVGFAKGRYPATVAAYAKPCGGAWAEGDTPRPGRSREDASRHRGRRPRRLLHRLDRGPHRRRHAGQRRADHEAGPGRVPGPGSARPSAARSWATRSSRCRRRARAASRSSRCSTCSSSST